MFSSLSYVNERHAPAIIPGQPKLAVQPPGGAQDAESTQANTQTNTQSSIPSQQQQQQQQETDGPPPRENSPVPDPVDVFDDALHELSRDLVMKEQQIEYLISVLPGIGQSEQAQKERMRELEVQLREVEEERTVAAQEKEELLRRVETAIGAVKRV